MKKQLTVLLCPLLLLMNACQEEVPPAQDKEKLEAQLAAHIRSVDALSPEEERASFTLPPGFEIQLFASEPDIGKPMNMAFDAKGRMWLTQSNEYPFPNSEADSKDRISILEDTDGDGKADRFTTFADALNIPIGITTVPDGAIAYSIPNIYHFIDSDGDDVVDQRKVLYAGFQYKDTHGMINNLVRSWDGWIHADHGFANNSKVAGTDGDTILLNSGNTFRFKADGSRIEFTTTGRVNPYGYAFDDWGYTYSVDCHSSPIYQLVRGADYPHFGKKPSGIGFGPALMTHNYGSTALAGLEYYLADQFPEDYQQSFYLGDVVKSRVYRSTISMQGTTPVVKWEDDFMVSDDPWFRPVDVKLGPDGALYIADFYNRIIGHYEVALDHPGRDRQRGRIWRVVYTGNNSKNINWSEANLEQLLQHLDHKNFPLRMIIADQIVDRFKEQAIAPIKNLLKQETLHHKKYVQGLWILHRLNALENQILLDALNQENPYVQVHTLRLLFEQAQVDKVVLDPALNKIHSDNPHIQRQAVMLISQYPDINQIRPLINLYQTTPAEDSHLKYSIKQSLRDQLRDEVVLQWVADQSWSATENELITSTLLGVDNAIAANFLLKYLGNHEGKLEQENTYYKHISRYLPLASSADLVSLAKNKSQGDPTRAYQYYQSIKEGAIQGQKNRANYTKAWGKDLAQRFLQKTENRPYKWRVLPNLYRPYPHNPWQIENKILSSGPRNNSGGFISEMQSPIFELGTTIAFELWGRKNSIPDNETALQPANKIELRLVDTDSLIQVAEVTELEHQEQINWNTSTFEGASAYLVLKDGSGAWGDYIGISDLNGIDLALPQEGPQQIAAQQIFAAQFAQEYKDKAFIPALLKLLSDTKEDIYARAKALESLQDLAPTMLLTPTSGLLSAVEESILFKEQILHSLSKAKQAALIKLCAQSLEGLRYQEQKKILLQLASSEVGRSALFNAAQAQLLPPRILQEKEVQENFVTLLKDQQKLLIENWTKDLIPPDESLSQLIEDRIAAYSKEKHSLSQGSQIFDQHCASCHEIKGQGSNIGPQLDGIGNWGSRALTEKILDPNRNISKAFKNYIIKLKDGTSKGGLYRREEGAVLIFADATGKEFSIAKDQIAEQKLSPYTLMPNYFGASIEEKDYLNLLAFLLNER